MFLKSQTQEISQQDEQKERRKKLLEEDRISIKIAAKSEHVNEILLDIGSVTNIGFFFCRSLPDHLSGWVPLTGTHSLLRETTVKLVYTGRFGTALKAFPDPVYGRIAGINKEFSYEW